MRSLVPERRKEMELEKIRNLSDGELVTEEKKAAEQLFRLRFQMKLGQNEGVKKLRELRKDVARIKTIARERELGLHGEKPQAEAVTPQRKGRPGRFDQNAEDHRGGSGDAQGAPQVQAGYEDQQEVLCT